MLHLNSGFEKLLFKSRRTLPKPTQVTQRHMGAWHFPMWRSSYPLRICETQCPIYQKWSGRAESPMTICGKGLSTQNILPKPSTQKPAHPQKWGAPATVLMNAAGRVACHPAKLPVNTDVLLCGLREAQEEGVTPLVPRRTPVRPLAWKAPAGSGACGAGKLLH